MNEINTVGMCKDACAIIDALEGIENDIKGMAGWLNYNASSHGMAVKTLKAIAQEIGWLASDVAEIFHNGATFMKAYQTMGAYEFKIENLYDIIEDVQADYWRDEIYDNIEKLGKLYAPMIRVMEKAVIKHARGE